jgi:hypothetical protein
MRPGETREWADVGRGLLRFRLDKEKGDLEDVIVRIYDDLLEGDDPDAADVREARRALGRMRWLLEEFAAPVSDGVEPWGDGVNSHAPKWAKERRIER